MDPKGLVKEQPESCIHVSTHYKRSLKHIYTVVAMAIYVISMTPNGRHHFT